jgi:hypothetical protein
VTITLEVVETLLLKRAAGRMQSAGMDYQTYPGNASLVEPLIFALLCMDLVPASMTALSDADFIGVADTDLPKLLDLAELRLLENVAGNLALVDVSVGPRKENLSQLLDQTEKAIARLSSKVQRLYGLGVGSLEAGTVSLDFASKGDDILPGELA